MLRASMLSSETAMATYSLGTVTRKKSPPDAKRPRPTRQRAPSNSGQKRLALGRAREAGEALFPVPPSRRRRRGCPRATR